MSRGWDQLLNRGESYVYLREALDQKQMSSRELTEECLRRAELDSGLNAFLEVFSDSARAQADQADQRLRAGERGPLLGIPVGVKDLILTQGRRTTAASRMLENFTAPYDATVVRRLKQAGAPILGKCNLDEFAMGSSNENSFFGPVKNPWDLSRVPGGSSGGSAAAVAARLCPMALGTDTGGSIRQPAALCGATGIKPTYGNVSRYGVIAFASSLDQVGPIAVDALTCAASLEVLVGADPFDGTSQQARPESFVNHAIQVAGRSSLRGVRIGLVKEFSQYRVHADVERIWKETLDFYQKEGAELVELELPHLPYSLPTYYLVASSECSSNLARYDGVHYGFRASDSRPGDLLDLYCRTRGEGFGREVKFRIMMGTYALSSGYYEAYFKKAAQVRRLIAQDFERAFTRCDVIASPTSPTTAFRFGEKTSDPLLMWLSDVFTLPINLAGLPSVSFNGGWSHPSQETNSPRLPVGMQLIGPRFSDASLLGLVAYFQKRSPHTVAGATRESRLRAGNYHEGPSQ